MPPAQQEDSLDRFVLDGVSWRRYLHLLQAFDGRRVRVNYCRGSIEITSVSCLHERYKALWSLLISMRALYAEDPCAGFGSMNLRRRSKRCGLEPDACFFVQHEPQSRGRRCFNWEVDPMPDLVLEIELEQNEINRLDILAELGVPEVWHWHNYHLATLLLSGSKTYTASERSQVFPDIKPGELTAICEIAFQQGDLKMVKALETWVRDQAE